MRQEFRLIILALFLLFLARWFPSLAYFPARGCRYLSARGRLWLGLAAKSSAALNSWRQQCRLELARLAAINQQQRRLLDAGPAKQLQFLPVTVLGQRPGWLLLGAGRDRQLQRGQLVVSERGLLGKIVAVGPYQARVMLLDNSDFRLAVAVWRPQGKNHFLAQGIFNGSNREVEQVLKSAPLQKGDLVAPLGLGGQFFLGQVVALAKDNGPYQRLRLRLNSPRGQFLVFVVKNLLPGDNHD